MTAEQQEGNKLIAKFYCGDGSFETYFNPVKKFHFAIEEAEYHSSWDWLYPVIEKILKTWIPENGEWPYEYLQLQEMHIGISIENIYPKVVTFIKWYNNNQNKQS